MIVDLIPAGGSINVDSDSNVDDRVLGTVNVGGQARAVEVWRNPFGKTVVGVASSNGVALIGPPEAPIRFRKDPDQNFGFDDALPGDPQQYVSVANSATTSVRVSLAPGASEAHEYWVSSDNPSVFEVLDGPLRIQEEDIVQIRGTGSQAHGSGMLQVHCGNPTGPVVAEMHVEAYKLKRLDAVHVLQVLDPDPDADNISALDFKAGVNRILSQAVVELGDVNWESISDTADVNCNNGVDIFAEDDPRDEQRRLATQYPSPQPINLLLAPVDTGYYHLIIVPNPPAGQNTLPTTKVNIGPISSSFLDDPVLLSQGCPNCPTEPVPNRPDCPIASRPTVEVIIRPTSPGPYELINIATGQAVELSDSSYTVAVKIGGIETENAPFDLATFTKAPIPNLSGANAAVAIGSHELAHTVGLLDLCSGAESDSERTNLMVWSTAYMRDTLLRFRNQRTGRRTNCGVPQMQWELIPR